MCHQLVFVTCIYRYYDRSSSVSVSEEAGSDEKDDDYTTRQCPRTTQLLTTHIALGSDYSSNTALPSCQEERINDMPSLSRMHENLMQDGKQEGKCSRWSFVISVCHYHYYLPYVYFVTPCTPFLSLGLSRDQLVCRSLIFVPQNPTHWGLDYPWHSSLDSVACPVDPRISQ